MIIGEVCLHTNDVIKLADFYRKLLMINDENSDETHQFIITEGATLTIFNDGTPKNNQNQNISLAFTVEDVDLEYQRLLNLGVIFINPPKIQPWGAKNMRFCDPDGNNIYFRSFKHNDLL